MPEAVDVGVCVVVPTYNEADNIGDLVERIERASVPGLVALVVDDSSPDGTGRKVEELSAGRPWLHLLTREKKRGIGSAYQDGFRHAISNWSPDFLAEMDADLQHPPATISALVEALEGGADVAVASRYVKGGATEGWSRGRRLVSWGANAYARFMLRIPTKDCTSGFRAYKRTAAEVVISSELPAKGFEFQVASLALLKKAKIVEVPYTFAPRTRGSSKLGFGDGVRFFFAVASLALR